MKGKLQLFSAHLLGITHTLDPQRQTSNLTQCEADLLQAQLLQWLHQGTSAGRECRADKTNLGRHTLTSAVPLPAALHHIF